MSRTEINLSEQADGILPVANGGTGQDTLPTVAQLCPNDILGGVIVNTAGPTSPSFAFMPNLFNDLAYNNHRGGSVSATVGGTAVTISSPDNFFTPDGAIAVISGLTAGTPVVILVDCCISTNWVSTVGLVPTAPYYSSTVKIEYYLSTADTWNTAYDQTGITSAYPIMVTTPNYGGTDEITQLRYTLTPAYTVLEISSLFLISPVSPMLGAGFMELGGATMYGGIDMNNNAITGLPAKSVPSTAISSPAPDWVNVLSYGADPTGKADSTTAFKDAVAALPAGGGWVYAPSGSYLISSTIALTEFQCLRGDGRAVTVLNYTGTGACVSATNTANPTGLPTPCGFVGFTIDGTNAGTGAVGLQLGNLFDSFGEELCVQHFATTGAIGLYFKNYGTLPVVNRMDFRKVLLVDNSTAVTFDVGNVKDYPQFAYCVFEFYITASANQCGITLQNSASLSGSVLWVQGNFTSNSTTNSGWVLGIDPASNSTYGCVMSYCDIYGIFESDLSGTGSVGHKTIVIGTTSGNGFNNAGKLYFGGVGSYQAPTIPIDTFSWSGPLLEPVLAPYLVGDVDTNFGGFQRNVLVYTAADVTANKTALTLNVNAEVIDISLPAATAVTVSGFTGEPYVNSRRLDMVLRQPSSGSPCTITWPSNIEWGIGNGTLSTTNGSVDKASLTYFPSNNSWYGELFTGCSAKASSSSQVLSGSGFWSQTPNGFQSLATAAGTTTLTSSSPSVTMFTGSDAQTVVLPSAETIPVGQQYTVINTSTGAVTVEGSGGTTISTVNPLWQTTFTSTSAATAAGVWYQSNVTYNTGMVYQSDVCQFPTLTAGTGISVSGNTITNTGLLDEGGGAAGMWFGATSALPTTGTAGVLYVCTS